jgi:hypothetical protein
MATWVRVAPVVLIMTWVRGLRVVERAALELVRLRADLVAGLAAARVGLTGD